MNRFYTLLTTHIVFVFLLGTLSLKGQADTLYYEDFSDSTLSNWTVVDSTNMGFNWIWTMSYPSGHFRPNTTSLNSTTSSNGFICLPADFYNTPFNPPASGNTAFDAWITSKAIPIRPSGQVNIQFRQFLSYCCRSTGIVSGIYLQISSDSSNWFAYDVTSINARSGSTANSELQTHNISSVLSGEDTAYVRFVFSQNSHYYWMIDDVLISGTMITSIDDQITSKSVKIYPNPSKGLINIQGKIDFNLVEVRDLNGRLVHQQDWNQNDQNIDLSFLENGLYFLRLRGDEERVEKLIIQH